VEVRSVEPGVALEAGVGELGITLEARLAKLGVAMEACLPEEASRWKVAPRNQAWCWKLVPQTWRLRGWPLPSRRSDAISGSSAVAILASSSLVHPVMGASPSSLDQWRATRRAGKVMPMHP
jgi:hypothetical protein